MKFLIDAQLPPSLSSILSSYGKHNVIHTLSLPQKNRTNDKEITAISLRIFEKNINNIYRSFRKAKLVEINKKGLLIIF